MKITDIRLIKQTATNERLKAFASITFDDCFVLKDVKVIQSNDNLFVAMPSKRKHDSYVDIAHPITKEFRNYVEEEVLNKYKEELNIN